ncbi:OLC1v1019782C1 [Oldenlandia corymbosa var. corymbosa]|uniref:OLC1v1019782C1 n=1 Tax=Oldenlandia corymbosa var. corymbosa TaxID=529605 RepID=A0AAV1EER9_OLDCO|nr:OLC1v1019782C1 [Oldenlandia corymbosa var. corymbosa]
MFFSGPFSLNVYGTSGINIVNGVVAVNNRMTHITLFIHRELNYSELVDKVCRATGFDKERVTVSFVLVWAVSSGRRGCTQIVPLIYLVSQNLPELYIYVAPTAGVNHASSYGQGTSAVKVVQVQVVWVQVVVVRMKVVTKKRVKTKAGNNAGSADKYITLGESSDEEDDNDTSASVML